MTKRSPDDPAFNKVVRAEIEGTRADERVVFIDMQNEVREAVYPSEFSSGELLRIRTRLDGLGELKAVVHISATVLGDRDGHGPRTSLVEYLPTGQNYAAHLERPRMTWIRMDDKSSQQALAKSKRLFAPNEGST